MRNIFLLFRNRLYIVNIAVACIWISCEKEIDIKLNEDPVQRIVVEGRITNEYKRHSVRLTKTEDYFYNKIVPPLLNAEVYMIAEHSGNRYDLELTDSVYGIYQTPEFSGIVGETYSLHVIYNEEEYKASAYLDTVAQMDSINYIYEYDHYFKTGYYKIRMSAMEPEPIGDIYSFYIYKNDSTLNSTMENAVYQADDIMDGEYMANIELMRLRQEEVTLDTNVIRVEMLSLSMDELYYNIEFQTEVFGNGSIFSGPPANIPSNFKNQSGGVDGLGFFGASSVVSMEMLLIKQHDDALNDPDYEPGDMYH